MNIAEVADRLTSRSAGESQRNSFGVVIGSLANANGSCQGLVTERCGKSIGPLPNHGRSAGECERKLTAGALVNGGGNRWQTEAELDPVVSGSC